MQFRVLGPLEVRAHDGALVQLGAAKQRTLLALLLLHPNRLVRSDRLLATLWPQRPPPSTASLVRTYVSALRRRLGLDQHGGSPAIATTPGGYHLRVGDSDLDSLVFERAASGGMHALNRGDLVSAADQLHRALSLWRGYALEDVALEGEAAAEVARLAERRLAAEEAWIDARLGLGQHRDLVTELRVLVAEHPLRERLWAQWMLALYRCGRQAEALSAFRELRGQLVRELGVEPSVPLQRLHGQILAGDPALEHPHTAIEAGARAGAEVGAGAGAGAGADQRNGAVVDRRSSSGVGQRNGAGAGREAGAGAGREAGVGVDRPDAVTARPVAPRQLPPDVGCFTGRGPELAALRAAVRPGREPGPVAIVAVNGVGGIGKSALTVHAAHQLAGRFPDGQLYANLHGATAGLAPIAPLVVVSRFLRALGADAKDLTDLDEAAARYRAAAAGRRLLIVLDDARDAAQVRPLLPASPSCAVVVTSRRVLAALDGATHVHLDILSPAEAVGLIGRLAGGQRVAAAPRAAAQVARLCGRLPLALRIAGARLATRPHWPVQALADRLSDAQRRLDELQVDDLGVRTSFRVSYHLLRASRDPADRLAADAFLLLGLPDGPDLGLPAVARLLDRDEATAERVVERLVDAQLVESTAAGRYRMHDLLRLFAREHVGDRLAPEAQAAALTRLLGWYTAGAWQAHGLMRTSDARRGPGEERWAGPVLALSTMEGALDWLEAERANLVAAVDQAAGTGGVPAEIPIEITRALFGFFLTRGYWHDWTHVNHTALAVARRTGDRLAEARVRDDLGVSHALQGRHGDALPQIQRALAIFRAVGDRYGQASALNHLGILHLFYREESANARARLHESEAISRELGDLRSLAAALYNLGSAYGNLGEDDNALRCLREALAIAEHLADDTGQAIALSNLGEVYARQSRHGEALACLEQSLASARRAGDRVNEAEALFNLGAVQVGRGRHAPALAAHRQSLAIFELLGERYGQARCLHHIGLCLHALGDRPQARTHWQRALAIYSEIGLPAAGDVRNLLTELTDDAPATG